MRFGSFVGAIERDGAYRASLIRKTESQEIDFD